MTMDAFRPLDDLRTGRGQPERRTLQELDDAKAAILTDINARSFHMAVCQEKLFGMKKMSEASKRLHRGIEVNCRYDLYRYRFSQQGSASASYTRLARELLDKGDAAQAALALERVLRCDPLDSRAWAVIKEMKNCGHRALAQGLNRRFFIKRGKRIGEGRLCKPICVVCHGDRLIVSDEAQPHVSVFRPSGGLEARLELGLRQAVGIVSVGDGAFWICEFRRRRLVRFDLTGRKLETLQKPRDPSAWQDLSPIWPTITSSGRLFFMASDFKRTRHVLCESTPKGFETLYTFPWFPSHVILAQGEVILARQFWTGRMFSFDEETRTLKPMTIDTPSLGYDFAYAHCDSGWFIDFHGRLLAKFTNEGDLEYTIPYRKDYAEGMHILHICTGKVGDKQAIYAADTCGCIHSFIVR
jgi:hypothetical protein